MTLNKECAALMLQAAQMLDLDAQEWRSRPAPDHYGRGEEQQKKIAEANEGMARLLRSKASELEHT